MGRPKKDIDEAKVAKLALDGASVNEIAALVGCDDQTLHNRFSKLIHQKKAERRVKLRQAQMKAALRGNPAMLIWLGKQELEQVDRANPTPAAGTTNVIIHRTDGGADGA